MIDVWNGTIHNGTGNVTAMVAGNMPVALYVVFMLGAAVVIAVLIYLILGHEGSKGVIGWD